MNINESHYSASPRAEEGEGSRGSWAVRLRAAMWVRLCRRSARWRIGDRSPIAEPTLDRLEQDEDDQPDAVGVMPRPPGKESLPTESGRFLAADRISPHLGTHGWPDTRTSLSDMSAGESQGVQVVADASPNLSFVIPAANENRWSDLLATLISTDPVPIVRLLDVDFDTVRREVVVPGQVRRKSDRLDLLLLQGDREVAAIEVKLLSDLAPQQLERYRAAFPSAGQYRVLHLDTLPVNLLGANPWKSLTWESVLTAHGQSKNAWVAATARAWLVQLASLVPTVDAETVWNDVPDDPGGFVLALRARIAWLSRQMDAWCGLPHDIGQSSGGGNWAVQIWARAASATTPGHFVTAEIQEGLTAYEFRADPDRPYRERVLGPVVLLGLRQDDVTTSADFDWSLLHELFAEHVLDAAGAPRDDRDWHLTASRPNDPTDRANRQAIVEAGAPKWLGKGWGMKVAQSTQSCLFGARFQLPPGSTLGEIDAELRTLQPLIQEMAVG